MRRPQGPLSAAAGALLLGMAIGAAVGLPFALAWGGPGADVLLPILIGLLMAALLVLMDAADADGESPPDVGSGPPGVRPQLADAAAFLWSATLIAWIVLLAVIAAIARSKG